MTRQSILAALVLLVACACGLRSQEQQQRGSQLDVHIGHRPPASKDVIEAVLASGRINLSVSSTCHNVGTEASDATIGRFLAGFMAEMSAQDKSNWIETQAKSGTSTDGELVWICSLTLRHVDGDDRWGWGVQFHVRQSDGLVLERSFTCTGAG